MYHVMWPCDECFVGVCLKCYWILVAFANQMIEFV